MIWYPTSPPEFWGYSHTGKRVLFSRDGIRSEDSNTWQDFRAKIGSWIYKATQAEVKIGDPHRLVTSEGYLKKLKHDFEKAMSNLL